MDSNKNWVLGVIIALVVIVGGIFIFTATDDDNDDTTASNDSSQQVEEEAQPAEQNIVELAQATPDLSTLVTAVSAADLVDTLSGEGPFTVFAPTNEAFDALPAGTLDDLLKPENVDQLTDVLTYHVVAGEVFSSDLSNGQKVVTLQGEEITVTINDGKVMINDAEVITADVDASNGVVHIIDAVLLP